MHQTGAPAGEVGIAGGAAGQLTQEVSRMRISTAVVLTLALMLSGTAVMAQDVTNNWIGATGLVIAPSADTAPDGELMASFNWIDTSGRSTSVWSALFGITENFEAGVAHVRSGGSSETIGNLKYDLNLQRLSGSPQAPDLAIGVWDLGDDIDRAWYVVLSDDFGAQMTAARWSIGIADSSGGILDGLFGGAQFAVAESGLLQVDYDGDNLNAAYRHQIADQFRVGVGLIDGDLGLNATLTTGF